MKFVKFGTKFLKFGNSIVRLVEREKPVIPTDFVLYKASDIVGKYSDSTGPAFFFKPAETIEVSEITVYVGRTYIASNSNPNGDVDLTFIEEYDADKTHTKTLMSYQTAAVYGLASSTATTSQWFTDTTGGGRGDKGSNATSDGVGIHRVYGINPIIVDDVTLYEYTVKLANNNKLVFDKDHFYRLGFAAGFHNSKASELYTLGIDFAADENNHLVTHSNNSTSKGASYINGCYLPYFKVDGEVFTNFELAAEPQPKSKIVFSNGDFSTTTYNTISTVLNSLQANDKLSLFIRHAERGSATGKSGGLTSNGIAQAAALGTSLADVSDTNKIYAESTDVLRTVETAFYITDGRGDTLYSQPIYDSSTNVIESNISRSSVYTGAAYTSETNWDTVSDYCSNTTNHAQIEDVSQTILNHIVSKSTEKLNIFCSHDTVLVPMISYITNWQLIPTSSEWCNYLNGIAIITRSNGSIEIAPLNALL